MRLPIGKPVEATVLRAGVEKTFRVTPAERESVDARIRELPLVGVTASNLTGWSAKELKRPSRDGVRVRGVRPGGPADEAKPALRNDDVILSVDERPTVTFDALEGVVDALTRRAAPAGQGHGASPRSSPSIVPASASSPSSSSVARGSRIPGSKRGRRGYRSRCRC